MPGVELFSVGIRGAGGGGGKGEDDSGDGGVVRGAFAVGIEIDAFFLRLSIFSL